MKKLVLVPRPEYIDSIFDRIKDADLLFVNGARRTGKSCIAIQLEQMIRANDQHIVLRLNCEGMASGTLTAEELIAKFDAVYSKERSILILLDEVFLVNDWERAVNRFTAFPNCKTILFTSVRHIISEKLDAVREKRYGVMDMLPFSLEEFISFHGLREITPAETPNGEKRFTQFDHEIYSLNDVYRLYINYGGLAIMKTEYMDPERAWVITEGTYCAALMRGILDVGSFNNIVAVSDVALLRNLILIMSQTSGSNVSANSLAKQTGDYMNRMPSAKTIENYIAALLNSNCFYASPRYDIKTGSVLKTFARYYIVDTGLLGYISPDARCDNAGRLENRVYFELLRRGYTIFNGKLGRDYISFVVFSGEEKAYIQVVDEKNADGLPDALAKLRKIRDNHPKAVISFDTQSNVTADGIFMINALDFLMGAKWLRPGIATNK